MLRKNQSENSEKHRISIKFFVVLLLISICNLSKGSDNLLLNQSFEEAGTGLSAAGWSPDHCGYTRSNDYAQEGSWSFKVTGSGGTEEFGLGGGFSHITANLPESEKFTVSSNIYISSYTQGRIYGIYITVFYTDSSQKIFSYPLSASEITANMNTWKKYSLTFSTDPGKTISSMACWCLVWLDNTDKFIGTVYFDDLKVEVFKPLLYWRGDYIYNAANPDQAADDVLNRGFTYAVVSQYDNSNCDRVAFLGSKGFEVVKNITPTEWSSITFTPRAFSPYNDRQSYDDAVQELIDMLDDFPEITGIVDDVEKVPFPTIKYSLDGVASDPDYTDLEERIGNQISQSSDWPVFKNWPTTGSHNFSNLTMENIEYNFPGLSIDISGTPDSSAIISYYGSGFDYDSYEMAAQTFKPVDNRITRIDVMLRRKGSSAAYPEGNLYYYLTEVDIDGKPDLSKKISFPACTITSKEIDYSDSTWNGIEPLTLYFDPEEVGELDTDKQYAIVLESTKKNNDNWNNAYYYMAGYNNNVYNDGQAWKRCRGVWTAYALNDFWIKIYKPNPPVGFGFNQFHEDWIDFQCAVVARYVEDYRDIADSYSPHKKIWVYSGYEGENYPKALHRYDATARRAYTVNWKMLSAAGIDYAVCGYSIRPITATINALEDGNPSNPPKLLGGTMDTASDSVFMDRYDNCDGAMLFYLGGDYIYDPGWSRP